MEKKSVLQERLAEILTGVNAKHRPIPCGAARLLGVIFFLLAIVVGAFPLMGVVNNGEENRSVVMFLVVVVLLVADLVFLAWITLRYVIVDLFFFIHAWGMGATLVESPYTWLARYWQRNVVGKTLWLWRTGEQGLNGTVTRRGVDFDRRSHMPPKLSRPTAIIGIPLGGWFRGKFEGLKFTDSRGDLTNKWTAHNSGASIRLLVMTDNDALVEIRGTDGRSLTQLPILVALEFVNRFAEAIDFQWAMGQVALFYHPNMMLAELLLESAKISEEMWKQRRLHKEEVISLIDDVVAQLTATKRFIKSKEAEAIRDRLLALQQRYALTREEEREKIQEVK